MLYLSLPSSDGSIGNAVQLLNPVTAKLGAIELWPPRRET